MKWWWLSYADDAGFRGGLIVFSSDFLGACVVAKALHLSPGGQVVGKELPDHNLGPFEAYRVYSKQELDDMGQTVEPYRRP
jgi:hypothetical protein